MKSGGPARRELAGMRSAIFAKLQLMMEREHRHGRFAPTAVCGGLRGSRRRELVFALKGVFRIQPNEKHP